MIIVPIIIPKIQMKIEDDSMLFGINSKNEMDNITPPAKASILNINLSEGFLIIPINDPMMGPRTEIIKIKINS
jgi:hypothetical protein